MPALLPKHLAFATKTQAAAILALAAIHTTALVAVLCLESRHLMAVATWASPFLYCQLGLLAWWACLRGPRRFRRAIVSLLVLALLIALASRTAILGAVAGHGDGEWVHSSSSPWDDINWHIYFGSIGGFLTIDAPFILIAFVTLQWLLPYELTHPRAQSDALASSDWRFGIRDVFAAAAAIAAVGGLIAWLQPYPTWLQEYGYNAFMRAPSSGLLQLPGILTVVLATWFSARFLLEPTISPRCLYNLVLIAGINGAINVIVQDAIAWAVLGRPEAILVPYFAWLNLRSTFFDWIILASSFFLLRIAGFRITRVGSRFLLRDPAPERA